MSAIVMPYKSLLEDLAAVRCQIGATAIDGTTGVITVPMDVQVKCAKWISNVYKDCWELPQARDWIWPFAVLNKTVTVTNGAIALADISYGRWVSVWSADPRPTTAPGNVSQACGIPIRSLDQDGIWLSDSPNSSGQVFVFYIPRVPEFTHVPVVSMTTYALDDLVYDSSTGDCFRALGAYAGSTILDATKWERQLLYKNLQSATALLAESAYMRSLSNFDEASARKGEALKALDKEFIAAFPNSPGVPRAPYTGTGVWR